MAQIFMIYAAEERAKICANHKNLSHLRAKKTNRRFRPRGVHTGKKKHNKKYKGNP
jgi:hypothetical protein